MYRTWSIQITSAPRVIDFIEHTLAVAADIQRVSGDFVYKRPESCTFRIRPHKPELKASYLYHPYTTIPTMASRLAQVSGHISNAYGRGLLAGEVAIITGAYYTQPPPHARAALTTTSSASRSRTGTSGVSSQPARRPSVTCETSLGHRQERRVAVRQGGCQGRR